MAVAVGRLIVHGQEELPVPGVLAGGQHFALVGDGAGRDAPASIQVERGQRRGRDDKQHQPDGQPVHDIADEVQESAHVSRGAAAPF